MQEDFEKLIAEAGLNLLSTWSPRFLVSLHVPTKFGIRRQCGVVSYASEKAFRDASIDETISAIDEIKGRLLRASRTLQGDIAKGGEVKVAVKEIETVETGIGYPAH